MQNKERNPQKITESGINENINSEKAARVVKTHIGCIQTDWPKKRTREKQK